MFNTIHLALLIYYLCVKIFGEFKFSERVVLMNAPLVVLRFYMDAINKR